MAQIYAFFACDARGSALLDMIIGLSQREFFVQFLHERSGVAEEAAVALAEVVQAGMAVSSHCKTVFGAAPVACEQKFTLTTSGRQGALLHQTEFELARAVHHLHKSGTADIAQPVLRKDEMVTGIDITIMLDHACMTACPGHCTQSRSLPHPVG